MNSNRISLLVAVAAGLGLAACSENTQKAASETTNSALSDIDSATDNAVASVGDALHHAGNAVKD